MRKGRRIWRRRTWKKLAGVEQFTTIQLQSYSWRTSKSSSFCLDKQSSEGFHKHECLLAPALRLSGRPVARSPCLSSRPPSAPSRSPHSTQNPQHLGRLHLCALPTVSQHFWGCSRHRGSVAASLGTERSPSAERSQRRHRDPQPKRLPEPPRGLLPPPSVKADPGHSKGPSRDKQEGRAELGMAATHREDVGIVIAHLQESLRAGRRVLGTLRVKQTARAAESPLPGPSHHKGRQLNRVP